MNYDTLPNPGTNPSAALDFVFEMARELAGELDPDKREHVRRWLDEVRVWQGSRSHRAHVTCSICGQIGHRADNAIHSGEKP